MLLIEDLYNYNPDNIYLFEQIKNNIIKDGYFVKILYSTSFFTMNSLFLSIPFNGIIMENTYNCKIFFDINKNRQIINKIKELEFNIIHKLNINKKPFFKIYEQLKNGSIFFFKNYNINKDTKINILLKISGIWISESNYGLSYKFEIYKPNSHLTTFITAKS